MYCSNCGKELPEGAAACGSCAAVNGAANETAVRKDALTYDYRTVETNQKNAVEIVDCYEALGWELANKNDSYISIGVALNFRRNRKIKNKDQLNRLQVRLDDSINGIAVLEKRKAQNAVIAALIIGIAGTLIFGGGMCLCLLTPFSNIVSYTIGSLLGVIGAALCGIGYMVYRKIAAKDTITMNGLIDKKRDEISRICEDAQKLLS